LYCVLELIRMEKKIERSGEQAFTALPAKVKVVPSSLETTSCLTDVAS